jgi:hypothetical protein
MSFLNIVYLTVASSFRRYLVVQVHPFMLHLWVMIVLLTYTPEIN